MELKRRDLIAEEQRLETLLKNAREMLDRDEDGTILMLIETWSRHLSEVRADLKPVRHQP